jgi:rfaE bifunctional protein kinase chain/domain
MRVDQARHALELFSNARVLVAGDLMLDEYLDGEVNRICPEAPVPVVHLRNRRYAPGGAANVAANARAMGAEVLLAGVVGDDPEADRLLEELRARNIDGQAVMRDGSRFTTTKTRVVAQGQQLLRVDKEDPRAPAEPVLKAVLAALEEALPQATVCVLSDYAKGLLSPTFTAGAIAACRRHGVPVLVDPKGRDYAKYAGARVLTPNRNEGYAAARLQPEFAGIEEVGLTLAAQFEDTAIVLTLGAEGVAIFEPGQSMLRIPSAAREVFDVTGAGDTLAAVTSVALGAGLTLREATWLGNRAAGIAVAHHGTYAITREELRAELHRERPQPGLGG